MKFKQFIYNQYLTIKYTLGHTKQYHSGTLKYRPVIVKDLLAWQLRQGEFNMMYYAMGLQLKGSRQKDYIGKREFLKIKNKVGYKLRKQAGCKGLNYDVVTKDKFYSNSIFAANGVPCIANLALLSGNRLIYPDGREEDFNAILKFDFPFFLKNNVLESGEGVFLCKPMDRSVAVNGQIKSLNELKDLTGNKKWIIQKKIESHPAIRKINNSALNTTRIVTIMNGTNPVFLCGFQAFATGNEQTDSWSHNSIYVGINNEKECLMEFGITNLSDKRSGYLAEHPDSGVRFKDYHIPFLKDSVGLCIEAHKLLYFNFIIGWDVAITDLGPVIVEANEKPGMNVAQALNGGLMQKIMGYAGKILNE